MRFTYTVEGDGGVVFDPDDFQDCETDADIRETLRNLVDDRARLTMAAYLDDEAGAIAHVRRELEAMRSSESEVDGDEDEVEVEVNAGVWGWD
jgi:hypothetical protein